jgi:hypothetical protein
MTLSWTSFCSSVPTTSRRVKEDQSPVAHKLGPALVFLCVYLLFDNAHSHGFLDDLVVVGESALVDLALEDLGRVMAATDRSVQGRVTMYIRLRILGSSVVVDKVENAVHLIQLGFRHGLALGRSLGRGYWRVVLAHYGFRRHHAQFRERSLFVRESLIEMRL